MSDAEKAGRIPAQKDDLQHSRRKIAAVWGAANVHAAMLCGLCVITAAVWDATTVHTGMLCGLYVITAFKTSMHAHHTQVQHPHETTGLCVVIFSCGQHARSPGGALEWQHRSDMEHFRRGCITGDTPVPTTCSHKRMLSISRNSFQPAGRLACSLASRVPYGMA
eukprot:1124627-Pelagomonas_calceolata.AAC.3